MENVKLRNELDKKESMNKSAPDLEESKSQVNYLANQISLLKTNNSKL